MWYIYYNIFALGEDLMEFKDKLVDIFKKYNINLSEKQAENFTLYKDMLVEWNKIHNLTAITDDDGIILKHFLDSVLPYTYFKDNSTIIDIGTGAGFPSIPLKIMNDTLNFTLVDSVVKKLNFVRAVVERLGLDNVNIVHVRCEDLAKNSDFRERYDYSVSRAVSSMSTLIEYCVPFIRVGGNMVCYKGSSYQDELDSATNAIRLLNINLTDILEYGVEELDTIRYVLAFNKAQSTDSKYPRGMNKPRLKPLG